MKISLSDSIGIDVVYQDYLGYERPGKIAYVEPYTGSALQDDCSDGEIVWVYIVDDDPEYNIHQMAINNSIVNYAELRLSTEICIESVEKG